MFKHKNKTAIVLTTIISLIFLLGFIALALSLVFSKGVCCGDDAYHAVIAKNLATGSGYASSVQPDLSRYTMRPFDPLVGTGPTIILPTSLFIRVFGNTYWAPGLANVVFWSLLLVLIGSTIRKLNNGIGFVFFAFSFLYLSYSLMTYHFEHWYALLGEVPAALLIILGLLWCLDHDTKFNQVLAGILFSLAVQAKLLALVAVLVFLIVHILIYPRGQAESFPAFLKKTARRICCLCIGFLITYVLFETWRLISLGPFDFIGNWRTYLRYAGSDGVLLEQSSSLMDLYNERSGILLERFGILPASMGLILMIVWLMIKRDEKLRHLFVILSSIIAIYSFWWFFLSNGWARYFIICLVLLIFMISLPLLSSRSKSYVILYVVLITIFSSNNWTRLKYPFVELKGNYFTPTAQTRGLLETTKILSQVTGSDKERIATQWWATAADIEYMMPASLKFTTFRDEALMNSSSFWLAVNTRFVEKNDNDFAGLLERCKQIQEIDIYIIAYCEASMP